MTEDRKEIEKRRIGRQLKQSAADRYADHQADIGALLDLPAEERVEGTGATVALAVAAGADIVRVHDVKEMARVAKVADAIVRVKHELMESDHTWADGPKKE